MFPLATFDSIPLSAANDLLVTWGHRMGPLLRGNSGALHCHALFANGDPIALVCTSSLIREHVGGGLRHLTRANTVELSRLCAANPWACRVVLRLWRELVFPALGVSAAISYQDACMHTGNIYRFDGWKVAGFSHSGTDSRSGKKGRDKNIWVWPPSRSVPDAASVNVPPESAVINMQQRCCANCAHAETSINSIKCKLIAEQRAGIARKSIVAADDFCDQHDLTFQANPVLVHA